MLDLCTFMTKRYPVHCVAGVVADASNGRRLVFNEEENRYTPVPDTDRRPKKVRKRVKEPVYSAVYSCAGDGIGYHVMKADEINKHGLNWYEIYHCIAQPNGATEEWGAYGLNYWLTGEGASLTENQLLVSVENELKLHKYVCSLPFYDRICEAYKRIDAKEAFHLFVSREYEKLVNQTTDPLGLPFGIELEFTGLARRPAAKLVAKCLGSTSKYVGGCMNEHHITDKNGRTWKIMRDGSITPEMSHRYSSLDVCKCELVTPICSYYDISKICSIIACLRRAGMKVNSSCGLHIHVDLRSHSGKPLKNLINIMAAREDLLFRALGIHPARMFYCRGINRGFLEEINALRGPMTTDIRDAWTKHCPGRYYALNLSSLFSRNKGIEFRCFNSTTDERTVVAYIQLTLCMCMQACNQERALHFSYSTASDRQQFRSWMQQMKMTGRRFKTTRKVILPQLSNEYQFLGTASA